MRMTEAPATEAALLGPAEIRALAAELNLRPTKRFGQNFVHDANTMRRIVAAAGLSADDVVLEVGPGLGSLTLALLPACRQVVAVEIDPVLAGALPATIVSRAPALADRLRVLRADALAVTAADLAAAGSQPSPELPTELPTETSAGLPTETSAEPSAGQASGASAELPTALVANLPYNVAVPVVLHLLAELPSLAHGLVMVQAEVADRLAAAPGSRTYGVPSVKGAWFARMRRAGTVPRAVFWPVPNVDSALVSFTRQAAPTADVPRSEVFAVIDAAFAQRRKTLRAALAGWAGSADAAGALLASAGVPGSARGEQLTVDDFARIALAARSEPADPPPASS
jgi:16S rRNA (adenine1518-N6/adenine1519-N6)-dimethyltransferase